MPSSANYFSPTNILVALIWVASLALVARGQSATFPNGDVLLQFGAASSNSLVSGGWWRLITAIFLSQSWAQLAISTFCLLQVGRAFAIYDDVQVSTIFLLAAVFANVVQAIAEPQAIYVGAQGGIFGLYAALCTFAYARWSFAFILRSKLTCLAFGVLAISAFLPPAWGGPTSTEAVLAGLLAGGLFGLSRNWRQQVPWPAVAAGLICLMIGLATAIPRPDGRTELIRIGRDIRALSLARKKLARMARPATQALSVQQSKFIEAEMLVPLRRAQAELAHCPSTMPWFPKVRQALEIFAARTQLDLLIAQQDTVLWEADEKLKRRDLASDKYVDLLGAQLLPALREQGKRLVKALRNGELKPKKEMDQLERYVWWDHLLETRLGNVEASQLQAGLAQAVAEYFRLTDGNRGDAQAAKNNKCLSESIELLPRGLLEHAGVVAKRLSRPHIFLVTQSARLNDASLIFRADCLELRARMALSKMQKAGGKSSTSLMPALDSLVTLYPALPIRQLASTHPSVQARIANLQSNRRAALVAIVEASHHGSPAQLRVSLNHWNDLNNSPDARWLKNAVDSFRIGKRVNH